MARAMVTRYGMEPEIGQASWVIDRPRYLDLQGLGPEQSEMSDRMSARIDDVIGRLVKDAFERAATVLRTCATVHQMRRWATPRSSNPPSCLITLCTPISNSRTSRLSDTAWSFAPLLKSLADAGYRAVAAFMRGYPPSGVAPDGDYRVITLGRDALALIEALGAQRAVLVGHVWGAAAAYTAAALAPERVERMFAAALPHLRRFVLWPTLRQLQRSRYNGCPW